MKKNLTKKLKKDIAVVPYVRTNGVNYEGYFMWDDGNVILWNDANEMEY